jgi:signal transduction histidine kinase
METMIAAVLGFVRDASRRGERERLDLLSLLEVVADDAAAAGGDVEVETAEAAVVEGDPLALRRLFTNLVDNAVKYGGRARLRLFISDGAAVAEIADAGPGLPPGAIEKVFEPFFRLEQSRNRATGGIGLGLAVARSIARAHGGDVTLRSGPPGLTAVVRLPIAG